MTFDGDDSFKLTQLPSQMGIGNSDYEILILMVKLWRISILRSTADSFLLVYHERSDADPHNDWFG